MPERVVVGLSGGVDSSVAAALLLEQGYEVIGVMMRLWAEEQNRCCAPEAVADARAVAVRLGIPFYVVDCTSDFRDCVVEPFIQEYARGRTPNPCLACNRHVRFGRLLRHAQALDAPHLATGHYARIVQTSDGWRLARAFDQHKDQSYVLYMLPQEVLRRLLLPLGRLTKPEVRRMAERRGLPVAGRAESMDLCFAGEGGYRAFLRRQAPDLFRAGPILDQSGDHLGQHRGLPFYTVGQRRGLGIASREPLYVLRLDASANALIVGPGRELGCREFCAQEVSYVSEQLPRGPVRVQVKVRYTASLRDATWYPQEGERARVVTDALLREVAPGQAVVAYVGDQVLGGGVIGDL